MDRYDHRDGIPSFVSFFIKTVKTVSWTQLVSCFSHFSGEQSSFLSLFPRQKRWLHCLQSLAKSGMTCIYFSSILSMELGRLAGGGYVFVSYQPDGSGHEARRRKPFPGSWTIDDGKM